MTVLKLLRRNTAEPAAKDRPAETAARAPHGADETLSQTAVDIAPGDPFLAFCLSQKGVIDVEKLTLESPAVHDLREAGIKIVVPLISQGDLIGIVSLGPRLSEQEYTSDDFKLLQDLSTQAAPALKVAQLVRQQKQEAAERERLAQELRVARLIQQTLLPQDVPQLDGWHVDAFYQPARAVGGDFYDFMTFPDGRTGFIVADVTDKGVPAALVMATTRSILRAAAERLESPGAVLERTNEVLHKEIPPKMFVTCFVAVLDPRTGRLQFANAGHDVPYRYTAEGIKELRATGMPLGLMPGMHYEEKETVLDPGDYILLYSDGLVEAHDREGDMFGFPRLQKLLAGHADGSSLKEFLLAELAKFTGAGWEQEDDVTLVTIQYQAAAKSNNGGATRFEVASAPGNERQAMNRVAELVGDLLPAARLEKLKTAVAEATMNAMEHGNKFDPAKTARIAVTSDDDAIRVTISDEGGGPPIKPAETPDLAAKLSGEQSPRGWGLFLIQNMVDEMNVYQDEASHTIELIMNRTA